MSQPKALFDAPFTQIDAFIRFWAADDPGRLALADRMCTLTWGELDREIDRIAAGLQAEGVGRGAIVAIAGANAVGYALALFAALRAGACAALLPSSASVEDLAGMLIDSGARVFFLDRVMAGQLGGAALPPGVPLIPYQGVPSRIAEWMAAPGSRPEVTEIQPDDPCVILYSPGAPGGEVHSHGLRMSRLRLAAASGLAPDPLVIDSLAPLHSDAALVDFLGAVAKGARTEFISDSGLEA